MKTSAEALALNTVSTAQTVSFPWNGCELGGMGWSSCQ